MSPISLYDPTGSSPLVAAISWLQNTALGSVATSIAVLAVATVGFRVLSGRTEVRQGLAVIAGCFIVFGAPSIAAGIHSAAQMGYEPILARGELKPSLPTYPSAPAQADSYDPYAGASVSRN